MREIKMRKELRQEIERAYKILATMEPGTDEYKELMNEVLEMTDRYEKLYGKDFWLKIGIDVLKFGLPVGVGAWAFVKAMLYEEKGTITSAAGRVILGNLLRLK